MYRFRDFVVSEKHVFDDSRNAYCGVSATAIAYTPDVPKVVDLMVSERDVLDPRVRVGFDGGCKRLMYVVQGMLFSHKQSLLLEPKS